MCQTHTSNNKTSALEPTVVKLRRTTEHERKLLDCRQYSKWRNLCFPKNVSYSCLQCVWGGGVTRCERTVYIVITGFVDMLIKKERSRQWSLWFCPVCWVLLDSTRVLCHLVKETVLNWELQACFNNSWHAWRRFLRCGLALYGFGQPLEQTKKPGLLRVLLNSITVTRVKVIICFVQISNDVLKSSSLRNWFI